jgi:hypothetical protein
MTFLFPEWKRTKIGTLFQGPEPEPGGPGHLRPADVRHRHRKHQTRLIFIKIFFVAHSGKPSMLQCLSLARLFNLV